MLEDEVFKKFKLDKNKLIKYGFIEENDIYKYSKNFMDDKFRADICIYNNGKVEGKVYDLEMESEYANFRIESYTGEFVNTVKEEYLNILKDIKEKCFIKKYFIYDQSNRITNLINKKYGVNPEFLWEKFPGIGIFREKSSDKWFAIITNIDKSKLVSDEKGEIEILNIKLDDETEKYLKKEGIYPAYHSNKKNWVTIILDDTFLDEEIMSLIDISYGNIVKNKEWLVPANPKYYDVIAHFKDKDITTWKQSSNINIGDIVYIYVAEPYSAILYKCEVL